ncbi:MAG: type II toxin-antitoxin system Phd/YefM family antitoxin [Acidimicrobiales bacterium]
MAVAKDHAVGLRELRHNTSRVLARVRSGEIVDITEYGRPIARIIPVEKRSPTPIMAQLIESGKAQLAIRPGYRPKMQSCSSHADQLSEALVALRDEEAW